MIKKHELTRDIANRGGKITVKIIWKMDIGLSPKNREIFTFAFCEKSSSNAQFYFANMIFENFTHPPYNPVSSTDLAVCSQILLETNWKFCKFCLETSSAAEHI